LFEALTQIEATSPPNSAIPSSTISPTHTKCFS